MPSIHRNRKGLRTGDRVVLKKEIYMGVRGIPMEPGKVFFVGDVRAHGVGLVTPGIDGWQPGSWFVQNEDIERHDNLDNCI